MIASHNIANCKHTISPKYIDANVHRVGGLGRFLHKDRVTRLRLGEQGNSPHTASRCWISISEISDKLGLWGKVLLYRSAEARKVELV